MIANGHKVEAKDELHVLFEKYPLLRNIAKQLQDCFGVQYVENMQEFAEDCFEDCKQLNLTDEQKQLLLNIGEQVKQAAKAEKLRGEITA